VIAGSRRKESNSDDRLSLDDEHRLPNPRLVFGIFRWRIWERLRASSIRGNTASADPRDR